MERRLMLLFSVMGLIGRVVSADPSGQRDVPTLPLEGTRIVRVSTEPELQAAMGNLRDGDTLLLAEGTYALTRSLYVNGRNQVTIRGAEGAERVVLIGKGMDNRNYGEVPFGLWSNSANTTLAHLTLRDTYDNLVILNEGAQFPRIYSVNLLNAGSQFIKSNPTDVQNGIGVRGGRVEYCRFEYSGRPPGDHGAGVGYFNGISAHAAKNWTVRRCVFKNLHNPDDAAYLWNPAVLFWRNSVDTVTEENLFIDVDRAIAYGLDGGTAYFDHAGGVIRNNFVYLSPGLMSASRRAGSDGAIIAWRSPGTFIDHNTVLAQGNVAYGIEFRFVSPGTNGARNNLLDAPIHLRDGALATLAGNVLNAVPSMFVDAHSGDLHLSRTASSAIDQVSAPESVGVDWDGEARPQGPKADVGADEFVAPRPVITSFLLSPADAWVRFASIPGSTYELVGASNVSDPIWEPIGTPLTGSGQELQMGDPGIRGRSRHFYRIRVLP